jgi:hypothetical protein
MAKQILYNYNTISPAQITREQYTNVGASSFQLGDAARGFKGSTDFEIWDAATGGTQLVENTDYELQDIDNNNSASAGYDVYTKVRIINATYQTGNIYITYKVVLSYVDAVFYNNLYNLAIAAGASNIKYLTNADSPFTITDGDGYGKIICDTSGGDIDINLPTLAGNQNREIQFIHQVGGGLVTVNGEGSETIDGLTEIELPKQHDRMTILGTTAEWCMLEESISCELKLDTYAGYGSIDNKIIRLTNITQNIGNMFSENHSTGYNGNTEGLEITIRKSGKYNFVVNGSSLASYDSGISLNSSQLTTGIVIINRSNAKAHTRGSSTGGTHGSCSWSGHLEKDDVIRCHGSGSAPGTSSFVLFSASYLGN